MVGIWKLVSWQVIGENEEPQDIFGSHPKGYLILTPVRLEGDRLLIDTEPAPSIVFSGKIDFRRLVWERDQ